MLSDIYPANDGIECDKWSDSASAIFLNLIDNNKNNENNLTALICKVNCDTCEVVLYKHTSRGKLCLNNKLITQGYATTIHINTTLKNPNTRNTLKTKPVRMNTRNDVSITCLGKIII